MAKLFAISVFLITFAAMVIEAAVEDRALRRLKREWIVPPRKLLENVDYTNEEFIAKIRSDEETRTKIQYSLEGPGATEDPIGLFTVDPNIGTVKIHGILDREKTPSFRLHGIAKFLNGTLAEKDVIMHVQVLDQNDCTPVFPNRPIGAVPELSPTGTYVINITATDADEPNTPNSTVTYSIFNQIPPNPRMFRIDSYSGRIRVQLDTLDRETQEMYTLIIHGTDGGPEPQNTGTGTVIINVLDVNDKIPTLEKGTYEGSVKENTVREEVLRLQTIDGDQIYTDNWWAVYTIISGNEAGYFNIATDPKTNEGILVVTKEIDYEELKEVNLKVVVSNKAKYHSSVIIGEPTTYPIKIRVLNMPEGPRFQPSIKVISISEENKNFDKKKVIATYKALDSDTLQTATNVRYYKGRDVDSWLNIDDKTAEIRLNKLPDRESKYLVNGTYYAQIICISEDHPSKTATGTIAIQVEDFNDHCPILTSTAQTLCYRKKVVYVTAVDKDDFPNAEPYDFRLVTTETNGRWNIERLNDTTAILRAEDSVWPGYHTVPLEVRDLQGKFCGVQQLHVTVCICDEGMVCSPQGRNTSIVRLGVGAVFALLLGVLLLLLIPLLLLTCLCGRAATASSFQPFPTDQTQNLITYHTEGVGEDKDVTQLQVSMGAQSMSTVQEESIGRWGQGCGQGWGWGQAGGAQEGLHLTRDEWHSGQHARDHFELWDSTAVARGMGSFADIALSEVFLGSYYSKRAEELTTKYSKNDALIVYEYEDEASSMSSLEDICEHLHDNDNLAFLDDLGPKFKTLAEVCSGSAIETPIRAARERPLPKPVVRPAQPGPRDDGRAEIATGRTQPEVSSSSSISTSTTRIAATDHHESSSTSISTSTTRVAATDHHDSSSASASSAAVLTHTSQAPLHTVLLQKAPMYYTSGPVYVMEQQAHPTVLLAGRSVLGMQENMVLVDHRASGVTLATPTTTTSLEMKRSQTKAEVQPAVDTSSVLGLPGLGSTSSSGSVRIVKSQWVQTVEPRWVGQRSTNSSMSVGNGGMLPNVLGASQQSAVHRTVPQVGTHQHIQEERVSVVKNSTGQHGGLLASTFSS